MPPSITPSLAGTWVHALPDMDWVVIKCSLTALHCLLDTLILLPAVRYSFRVQGTSTDFLVSPSDGVAFTVQASQACLAACVCLDERHMPTHSKLSSLVGCVTIKLRLLQSAVHACEVLVLSTAARHARAVLLKPVSVCRGFKVSCPSRKQPCK